LSSNNKAGTCDLTIKERKFLKLKYKNNRAVDHIVDQYKRAIKIVNKYQNAEIKLIDCHCQLEIGTRTTITQNQKHSRLMTLLLLDKFRN
jgi:hypothetical protein